MVENTPMTTTEEREMHDLAVKLEQLTANPPWEAMRYDAIANVLKQLTRYCAVCDCQEAKQP
jgi:hypothetical protein